MTDIKNPIDSLQHYFDDLLSLDDSPLSDDSLIAETDATAQKALAANPKDPADKVAPSLAGISLSPNAENSEASSAAAVTQTAANKKITQALPAFAEPDLEQKIKLQKLLSSAPPVVNTTVVQPQTQVHAATVTDITTETVTNVETRTATKVFVQDPNEIQEWVVETVQVVAEVAIPLTETSSLTETSPLTATLAETTVTEVDTVETASTIEVQDLTTAYDIPGLTWLENGLPAWAQSRFDVLLFQVAGLTLAVPLISLGQIQPITDELTPLFGQADWFMGLQPTPHGKVRTVNTAKFVMPERYDEHFLATAKYVVSINGVPWGLAVDSVNQPISLLPEEVKWRSDRSKRPWLAGTVKQHMCALLDIPMIGQMLMNADKNALKKPL